MKDYDNARGTSNIIGYDDDYDQYWIEIFFADGSVYAYDRESCGEETVHHMLELARTGSGLNSYVSTYRPRYSEKR
jgi:hypothetical protein